jgi:hypothetical protein
VNETSYVSGDGTTPGELIKKGSYIIVEPHWGTAYGPEIWTGSGGHGGADPVMLDYIFTPDLHPEDPYKRAADQRSGAYSILCGVAANTSIVEGSRPVRIDELVPEIGRPDYPAMPTAEEPLTMPEKEEK